MRTPSAQVRYHSIASAPKLGMKVGIASDRLEFACLSLRRGRKVLSGLEILKPDREHVRELADCGLSGWRKRGGKQPFVQDRPVGSYAPCFRS